MKKKRCTKCARNLPLEAFGKQKDCKTGRFYWRAQCLECRSVHEKTKRQFYTEEQKAAARWKSILRLYGLTQESYNKMFETQQGKCPGCSRHQSELEKALVVDHCHVTGRVRGLLCSGCNLALGNVKEEPETLINLSLYLQRVNA